MASTDARPLARKNVAYRVTVPIFDADGDLVTGATGLDSEVSKDGGAFADCTNEATEIGSSGIYTLDLTSTEMDADTVAIIVKTSSVGAKTTPIILYPDEAGDIRADAVQLGGSTQSATDLKDFADDGYDPTTNKVQGVVLVDTVTTYTGNTPQTGDAFARLGAPAAASVSADILAIDNFVDDLESRLTAGRAANLDNLDAAVSSRSTLTTGQVNAEVLDVLNVDTFAELAAVPNAAATLTQILRWLYILARNQVEQTTTTQTVYADDGATPVADAAVSDNGTTFTRAEWS